MLAVLVVALLVLMTTRRMQDKRRAAHAHILISAAALVVGFFLLRGVEEMLLFLLAAWTYATSYRRWHRAEKSRTRKSATGAAKASPASSTSMLPVAQSSAVEPMTDHHVSVGTATAALTASGEGATQSPVEEPTDDHRSLAAASSYPDSAETLEQRQWRVLANSGYSATLADAYPSPYATGPMDPAEDAALAAMGIH